MQIKSKFKFLLWSIVIIILLLAGGIAYLKTTYNDNYLKNIIIKTLSAGSNVKIEIDDFKTSWLGTTVEISGVNFITQNDSSEDRLIQVDEISLHLDFWKSYRTKSLVVDIIMNGYKVNVQRILINNLLTGKAQYSTNVTKILNNIIELPWKEWLDDIDWSKASGQVELLNGNITVKDDTGELADCAISDMDIYVSRYENNFDFKLSFASSSPNSQDGAVKIDISAIFDLDANNGNNTNYFVNKTRLGFIREIKIRGDITDFDISYFLKYYEAGSKVFDSFKAELVDPVNASFSFTSNTLSNVAFDASFFCRKIVALYHQNRLLPDVPSMTIKMNGKFDFLKEWTEFSNLGIDLEFSYPDEKVCSIDAELNGNFGDNIILALTGVTNLTAFSNSALGQYLGLNLSGNLQHTAALNWSISKPWKINYSLAGKNFTAVIDGKKVSSQIKSSIDGVMGHDGRFAVKNGKFNFDFSAPFLKLKTLQPVELNFEDISLPEKSSLEFTFDFALFSNIFRNFFEKFGINKIDEVIAGEIAIDDNRNIDWETVVSSRYNKEAARINFKGTLQNNDDNSYTVNADINDEQKTCNVNLNSKILKSANGWEVTLAQSGIMDFSTIFKLYERFSIPLGMRTIPISFNGRVSEAVNLSAIISKDNISLGISNRINIKDFSTVINKYPVKENTVKLSSSFSLNLNEKNKLVKIQNLTVATDDSRVSLSTGSYDLNILKTRDWRKILQTFPEITADVDVGKHIMTSIGGAVGNSIANKFLENATVKGAFTSPGATKSRLSSFRYTAGPLSVEAQDEFTIDPLVMTEIIIDKDFFNIHKSLSDVDAKVSADMNNWKGIVPDVATNFIGMFNFNAKYYQRGDKLEVRSFSTVPTETRSLVVPELIFSGSLYNFFTALQHFSFAEFASSIDNRISIDQLALSVQQLKFLAGDNPGALIRALQGEQLLLQNFSLKHKADNPYVEIRGDAHGKLAFFSRSSKWPVLALSGKISNSENGIVLQIDSESVSARGGLDFSDAAVEFNALSPYKYNKKSAQPLELLFYGRLNENGDAQVREAKLVGGPLEVGLSGLSHIVLGPRYELKIAQIDLGKPLNSQISNLLLNSSADILKADILLGTLDLSTLQSSLNLNFPINISGIISGGTLKIDDSYWRYFAPIDSNINISKVSANSVQLGGANITLTSNVSDAQISFSIAEGRGNTSDNAIIFDEVKVASPKGYSDRPALLAENVSVMPDLRSLFSDRIIIDTIDINKMEVYYEMALKKSNIAALEDNFKNIFTTVGESSSFGSSRKTLIRDIYVNNSWVKLSTGLLGGKVALPIPLDLHLHDIGGDNAGTTFNSAFGRIFGGIGKVTTGVAEGVGTAAKTTIKGVGKISKSIIQAPLKLIKSLDGDEKNTTENIDENNVIEE